MRHLVTLKIKSFLDLIVQLHWTCKNCMLFGVIHVGGLTIKMIYSPSLNIAT